MTTSEEIAAVRQALESTRGYFLKTRRKILELHDGDLSRMDEDDLDRFNELNDNLKMIDAALDPLRGDNDDDPPLDAELA